MEFRNAQYRSRRFDGRTARVIAICAGNVLYDMVEGGKTERFNLFCSVERFQERYA
jgi:hypothetical protein